MKIIYSIICLSIMFVGCQPKVDNSAQEAFEKNCKTVLANLEGFQNENLDYTMYSKDFVLRGTGFGDKDSLSLEEVKGHDKWLLENFDFKIIDSPINLLPGVNPDTKQMDGSVRYYADWEVTKPATDSTAAKTGILKMYESFDFDAEGKIIYQQGYGDFTGLMTYLMSNDVEKAAE